MTAQVQRCVPPTETRAVALKDAVERTTHVLHAAQYKWASREFKGADATLKEQLVEMVAGRSPSFKSWEASTCLATCLRQSPFYLRCTVSSATSNGKPVVLFGADAIRYSLEAYSAKVGAGTPLTFEDLNPIGAFKWLAPDSHVLQVRQWTEDVWERVARKGPIRAAASAHIGERAAKRTRCAETNHNEVLSWFS